MHQLRQFRALLARDHRHAQQRARNWTHRFPITAVTLLLLVLLGFAACYETRADRYDFTSSLPLQILTMLSPTLETLMAGRPGTQPVGR